MSDSNSTAPVPSGKPAKPYPDFPLFPHAAKRWAKKIRGQLHYFGSWDDGWKAALDNYLKQKDVVQTVRKPRAAAEGTTTKEMANKFLNAKKASVDSGELAYRTWENYKAACALLIQHFGKSRLIDDLDPD